LNLVLDTDEGRGIVIEESDEGWWILLMICTITVTRNPAARTNSLSVGDRTLQVQRCSTCRQIQGVHTPHQTELGSKAIGADPQVIAPALASLLDDAAGKVITLAVSADMDRTLIIPSHHLPVFVVEPDR